MGILLGGWAAGGLDVFGRCWNAEHGFNSDAAVAVVSPCFCFIKEIETWVLETLAKCSCNKVGQEICSWERFIVPVFVFGTAVLPYFIYILCFLFPCAHCCCNCFVFCEHTGYAPILRWTIAEMLGSNTTSAKNCISLCVCAYSCIYTFKVLNLWTHTIRNSKSWNALKIAISK